MRSPLIDCPIAAASNRWRDRDQGNVSILFTPVQTEQFVHECDLVIGHGGHGLLTQSLLAGTPVLSFPLTLEQRLHAEKIQSLGAGLSSDLNAHGNFRELITRMLDDLSFRNTATAFQKKHNSLGEAKSNLNRVVNRPPRKDGRRLSRPGCSCNDNSERPAAR